MKGRYKLIFFQLFFIVTLCGCNKLDFNVEEKIGSPRYNSIDIYGTWEVKSFELISKGEETEKLNKYVNSIVVLDGDICALNDQVCIKPEYKMKSVAAFDYVTDKYKIDPEKLGISSDRIEVVTVKSNNQVFYDFIQVDNNTIMVYLDGGILLLNKVSDAVDEELKMKLSESYSKAGVKNSFQEDSLLRSGVLLGIRSEQNNYRTIWLFSRNKEVKDIMETQQIFVPRAKGFWEIGFQRKEENNSKSIMYTREVKDFTVESSFTESNLLLQSGERKIIFVGNDYIGTEYNEGLQVIPMDNIALGKGINLSDIIKDNVHNALKLSTEALTASLDKEKVSKLDIEPKEDNFTLVRRNGHWIMKGRLDYSEAYEGKQYEDFDINLMVSPKLVNYDELLIPWSDIKEKVPAANDAFVSPNKDIAVLVVKEKLYIYSIEKGKLSMQPVEEVTLEMGDTIIMAEWARGEYAEKWDKTVKERFDKLKND